MTNAPDYPDYTTQVSRFMAQLAQSPASANTAGVQSQVFDVPTWARSINFLVTPVNNVITLTVTGTQTGFIYLNAVPAYDGGIYYVPAMPVIDTQVTVTWYQVSATLVSVYAIASDEPISVSLFNPVSPTHAISERLVSAFPIACPANALTVQTFAPDVTTQAVRVSVDNASGYLWGRVTGVTTGKLYFDGSATNSKFPSSPIPIDPIDETAIRISVQTTLTGAVNCYAAAVNVPDFAASIPISNIMSPNTLAPDPEQSLRPNKRPITFDGTIAISAAQVLVPAASGVQLRLHAISIMQYTAVATEIQLQDTSSNVFFHYHYSAAANAVYIPLFGMPCDKSQGIRLQNMLAVATAALGVTLWYSVL